METKECQYCYSPIPAKAEKCRYCLEWQDKQETLDQEPAPRESRDLFIKLATPGKPFQLKLVEKIPLHYIVSIIIFAAVIFAAIQLSWYKLNEERIYLLSYLSFTVQLVVTWSGLIWAYSLINKNYSLFIKISSRSSEEAEQNFIKYHRLMFNNKFAIASGILIGTVASLGDFIVGAPFASQAAKLIFAVFEFINMFFAGAAIYTIFILAYYLSRISINPYSETFQLDKHKGIIDVGQLHLKTSILAIVPLFLGVIAKSFGDWRWEPIIILWYAGFAVAIIFYIYWPMYKIHNVLLEKKRHQEDLLQKREQKILSEITRNPSSRNFIKLNEVRELVKSISNQSTWPFDTKSISAAFVAIFFPVVLMIIDKIWAF